MSSSPNAAFFWRQLARQGGLEVDLYDAPLVASLTESLHLNPSQAFLPQLETISAQEFIPAFFKATAPYARMMRDLLAFFERAGAVESAKGNLRIAFDFGPKVPDLGFDLRSFRVVVQRLERAASADLGTAPLFNHNTYFQLLDIFERAQGEADPADAAVAAWLREYGELQTWPLEALPAPFIDTPELRPTLDAVWSVWEGVVGASRALGRRRSVLQGYTWQPRPPADADLATNPWLMKLLDRADWAGRMLLAIGRAARDPASSREAWRDIGQLLAGIPRAPRSGEALGAIWEELLSLPAWQRREDLYAAWVGAQIVAALGPEAEVHSAQGVLRYAFSGTHLATLRVPGRRPLHLWAELRSPLANPVGKGRKRGIQPDYSLQAEPITYPEASVLVVECKQYLKSSPKSFAAALTDYAHGRAAAVVLLVNYGPVPEGPIALVPDDVRARTVSIGKLFPGNEAAIEDFAHRVSSVLPPAAGRVAEPAAVAPSAPLAAPSPAGTPAPEAAAGTPPALAAASPAASDSGLATPVAPGGQETARAGPPGGPPAPVERHADAVGVDRVQAPLVRPDEERAEHREHVPMRAVGPAFLEQRRAAVGKIGRRELRQGLVAQGDGRRGQAHAMAVAGSRHQARAVQPGVHGRAPRRRRWRPPAPRARPRRFWRGPGPRRLAQQLAQPRLRAVEDLPLRIAGEARRPRGLARGQPQVEAEQHQPALGPRQPPPGGAEVGQALALRLHRCDGGRGLAEGVERHEAASVLQAIAMVDEAAIAQGAQQPGLGLADLCPLARRQQPGDLRQVLPVLRRDAVPAEHALHSWPEALMDLGRQLGNRVAFVQAGLPLPSWTGIDCLGDRRGKNVAVRLGRTAWGGNLHAT
jgi:hypothetical protein